MGREQTSEIPVILLVEDNSAHAELIMRVFEGHRIPNNISHVRDGHSALDYLLRRGQYSDPKKSPKPQLILLDIRLPRVDGLDVLKEIRSKVEFNQTPVVMLTTSKAECDVLRAYERKSNSYIVKPLDFDDFFQVIHDLGSYWLKWNCYPES